MVPDSFYFIVYLFVEIAWNAAGHPLTVFHHGAQPPYAMGKTN
jgi:hypothetical protein